MDKTTGSFKELMQYSQPINELKSLPELCKNVTEISLSFNKDTYLTSIVTMDNHLKEFELVKGLNPKDAGVVASHYMKIILERQQNGIS